MSRAPEAARGWRRRLDGAIETALRSVSSFCLVALLGLVSTIVAIRFVPFLSLGWEDEVVELAFAWMVFLGSAAVWRSHEHIAIDFIPQALAGSRAGRILEIAVGALALGFLAVLTWYGLRLAWQARGNTSPMLILPVPMWYAAVPVAGAIMIGYTLVRMMKVLRRPDVTTTEPRGE
jgi:TRAP-type C4-dicarboxylate transport system permease small subunit